MARKEALSQPQMSRTSPTPSAEHGGVGSCAWRNQFQGIIMALHQFKMGQSVNFAPNRGDFPSSGRRYEVLRQLPHE